MEGLSIVGNGVVQPTESASRNAQVIVDFGRGRVEPQGLAIVGLRFLPSSRPGQPEAQVVASVGEIGLEGTAP